MGAILALTLLAAPQIIWQTGFETPPPEYRGTLDPRPECWWPGRTGCNWLELASDARRSYSATCDYTLADAHWCYSNKPRTGEWGYEAWVNNAISPAIDDVQRGYIMGDQFRTIGEVIDLPGPFVHTYYVKVDAEPSTWPAGGWAALMSYSAHAFAEPSPQMWSVTLLASGVVGQWWATMPVASRPKFPLGQWVRVTTAFADTDTPRAVRTWVDGKLANYGPYNMRVSCSSQDVTKCPPKAGPNLGAFHPGAYVRYDVPRIHILYDDMALWHLDEPWDSDEEPAFVYLPQQPTEPPPVVQPEPLPPTEEEPPQPSSLFTCPGPVECRCLP